MDADKKRNSTLILLTVSTIIFTLLFFPGIWAAIMSVMIFDAPGSGKNIFLNVLFYSIASFPFLVLFSFTSWIFYALKRHKLSVIISLSPLLSIISAVLLLIFSLIFFNGSFGS